MSRTLHVVRPPIEQPLDVVDTHEGHDRAVALAEELWRLLENEEKATAIHDIIISAYGRKPPSLDTADLRALLVPIAELEKAIVGPLTDEDEKLSPEKVVELRARTQLLDLDESRGEDAQWAVGEAMTRVFAFKRALMISIDAGYSWVFE